jgi:hypothetical protein
VAIRTKTYANKAGKADKVQNRVQVTMDIDDAKGIAGGDKALRTELLASIKEVVKK